MKYCAWLQRGLVISKLRKNVTPKKRTIDPLVEALGATGNADLHENVVEHITGKRYKTAQPQDAVQSRSGKRGSGSKSSKSSSRNKSSAGTIFDDTTRPERRSGDPLDNLDI